VHLGAVAADQRARGQGVHQTLPGEPRVERHDAPDHSQQQPQDAAHPALSEGHLAADEVDLRVVQVLFGPAWASAARRSAVS
jgi:hypothetical protein